MAEEQGFEPWVGITPTTVFETVPFNRSGTPPLIGFAQNFHTDTRNLLQRQGEPQPDRQENRLGRLREHEHEAMI